MQASSLKVRIIPVLLLQNNRCVKGVQFTHFRDTGNPVTAARVYDSQKADELVFLDIEATSQERTISYDIAAQVAEQCFMPFTVGGGIKSVEQIRKFLEVGADKIALNTTAIERPALIREAAEQFGSQCVVVSIDVRKKNDGYEVFTRSGKKETGRDPLEWAQEAQELGAGEILLTSIDREGTRTGYDIELTKTIADALKIPVIANGGVGTLEHLLEGIQKGHASAVALSSMFHFTDQSTIKARAYLHDAGINVRPNW